MSGISVSDDAVNMYYFLKAKSTVRPDYLILLLCCLVFLSHEGLLMSVHADSSRVADGMCLPLQYRWATWMINSAGNQV